MKKPVAIADMNEAQLRKAFTAFVVEHINGSDTWDQDWPEIGHVASPWDREKDEPAECPCKPCRARRMNLRDDMTPAEAQAEAERRWPGACLLQDVRFARMSDVHAREAWNTFSLKLADSGLRYFADSPVGCLDQAIAAEARRNGPTPTHVWCAACGEAVAIADTAAMNWHGLLVKGDNHG